MTRRQFTYVVGATALVLCALALVSAPRPRAQEFEGNFGVGVPEVFLPRYLAYRSAQLASGSPNVMRVKLGNVKAPSWNFVANVGDAAINLGTGGFTVNLSGLTPLTTYTVWIVS
jgi:hypothetical protein